MPRSWGGSTYLPIDPARSAVLRIDRACHRFRISVCVGRSWEGLPLSELVTSTGAPRLSSRHTRFTGDQSDLLDSLSGNPVLPHFLSSLGLAHRFRRDQTDLCSLYAIFLPAVLLAAAWPSGIARIQPLARSVLADLAWVSRRRARVLGVEWDDPRRVVLHLRDRVAVAAAATRNILRHLCHDFRAPLGSRVHAAS